MVVKKFVLVFLALSSVWRIDKVQGFSVCSVTPAVLPRYHKSEKKKKKSHFHDIVTSQHPPESWSYLVFVSFQTLTCLVF